MDFCAEFQCWTQHQQRLPLPLVSSVEPMQKRLFELADNSRENFIIAEPLVLKLQSAYRTCSTQQHYRY
ncbi:hypothetical protein ASC87_17060 [Rhizobacter sp. Root1221]|nr:hypothetical protein ASC87_17060 [Rhizobacter sp. Root1221]